MFSLEEITDCPICASHGFSHAFQRAYLGQKFRWVACDSCGLTFQNPRPTERFLDSLFNSENYWLGKNFMNDSERAAYWDYVSEEPVHLAQAKQRAQWVSTFKQAPGSILDVACATGSFLKCMTDLGYSGEGIEVSKQMGEWGKAHYGISIKSESFLHASLGIKRYDIVSCWGAISNFYDPHVVLEKIHGILKDDGVFVLSFFDFRHPMRILRGRRFMQVPSQLYNYSESSLNLFLRKLGFKILSVIPEKQFASIEKILHLFNVSPKMCGALPHAIFWLPSFGGKLVAAVRASQDSVGRSRI